MKSLVLYTRFTGFLFFPFHLFSLFRFYVLESLFLHMYLISSPELSILYLYHTPKNIDYTVTLLIIFVYEFIRISLYIYIILRVLIARSINAKLIELMLN